LDDDGTSNPEDQQQQQQYDNGGGQMMMTGEGYPQTGSVMLPAPDLKVLKHISEKTGRRVQELQKLYPTMINNPDQTFGNIPSGTDFKLVMLQQSRLAIFGRARQGRITLKSIESQYQAKYIARMETLRGKDAMERIMLSTSHMITSSNGMSETSEGGKAGILSGVRKHLGM
jgi:hypothetical protein